MKTLAIMFTKSALVLLILIMTGCASQPDLITAARNNNAPRVETLLQNGYDPNVRNLNEFYGRTPLYYAAQEGYNDIVKALLASGAKVNAVSDEQWSALLVAARYKGDLETVRMLVEAGADIHFMNKYGLNALMLATHADKPEVVQYLIDQGMDPEVKDRDGKDSYDYAEDKKNLSQDQIRQYRANYVQRQKIAGIQAQIEKIEARDSTFPQSLKHDKYLIAYTDALKQENYLDAVVYANLLDKLHVPMEDAFYYFWGEALLKLNNAEQAKVKLNEYIKRAGSSGKYYTEALRLIIQAEN